MRLQILRRKLDDPEQLRLLGELQQTVGLSIDRLRHLLFELRPPVLDSEGLAAALEMYLQDAAAGSTTRYELNDRLRSQPSKQTRTILYRIVQEALVNVRKHAFATSVTVSLRERDSGYLVRIADDGVGFAVDQTKLVSGHLGLASMRERALLADGWMQVMSAPQEGTTIEVWVPALAPADEPDAPALASSGSSPKVAVR
jgi:signal transduction histidine kinase